MLVDAVIKRDYTLVQGIVLVYSLLVILMSLLVEILYGYIDPRIKRE
jgi:peptide/nickel transport system permease protein